MKIIDTNCSFGHWPIQKFPYRTLAELDAALGGAGITESWVSATESILFEDPDVYDLPLFGLLTQFPRLRPVKTVNPLLDNWRQSCLQALECHNLAALKIYPNYHGYPSNHAALPELADFAAEYQLPLLVSVRVNDERNQPANLRIAQTNVDALVEWARRATRTRFIFQGLYLGELAKLGKYAHIGTDIAFFDYADVFTVAIKEIGFAPERLFFGSHACFMYPESSVLKLRFSEVEAAVLQQVASQNLETAMV